MINEELKARFLAGECTEEELIAQLFFFEKFLFFLRRILQHIP